MSTTNPAARVALVGDRSLEIPAHRAIPRALELAAAAAECAAEGVWIATTELADPGDAAERLAGFDAIWCVPGSPYASMEGALNAIRIAREGGRPFLGTCGGFQHALIEYARNVLGMPDADHAESNADAAVPLISSLVCALREVSGTILLREGSRLRAIYGQAQIVEAYNCNFGVNPDYQARLEDGSLSIAGVDEEGGARAVELRGHPFFIATLFQPERTALDGRTHPLIAAYLRAADVERKRTQ